MRWSYSNVKTPACSVEGINQTLINLYDTRYLYAATHSRALLGDGENWAREIEAYLHKHQLGEYLRRNLERVEV